MVDPDRLSAAYETARCDLLAESTAGGRWIGRLSSSPLATAAAISALSVVDRHAPTLRGRFADESRECRLSELIMASVRWLADRQNADGGWGDAEHSASNVAATLAVRSAFALTAVPADHPGLLERADAYLKLHGGPHGLARSHARRKILAAAILANAALAGLVAWRRVPSANFELTCCQRLAARWLGGATEEQASAAEIATTLVRYQHRKPWNPLARLLHRKTMAANLRAIAEQQSIEGSFLESAPMTSFVVMCLAASGAADHEIVRRGVEYLLASVRPDGSWPIAGDMGVRNTALALGALAAAGDEPGDMAAFDWLLACQRRGIDHGSETGGWSWTDRQVGVVNTLDTSTVLLALAPCKERRQPEERVAIDRAAAAGVRWLLAAQNADGGWPTVGGSLDRQADDDSRPDMTADALRALVAWRGAPVKVSHHSHELHTFRDDRVNEAVERGVRHLVASQHASGSWSPTSHGEAAGDGSAVSIAVTAKVLLAFRALDRLDHPAVSRALHWLVGMKHGDGSWGGTGGACESTARRATVEETAGATAALFACDRVAAQEVAAEDGLRWLIDAVESNRHQLSAPVGRTLGGLWYDEKLYPLVATVAALGRKARQARPSALEPAAVQVTKP